MFKLVIVILAVALSCHARGIDGDQSVKNVIEAVPAEGAEEIQSVKGDIELSDPNARSSADTTFYLYRQADPHRAETVVANEESILEANFSNETLTVIMIHGHAGNAFTSLNPEIRQAILAVEDVNLVVVDWSAYASLSYTLAVGAVPLMANNVANFLNEIINANVTTLADVHIIGFNLGAHIAGIVGRTVPTVARITGLDPSGSQWGSSSSRLRITDAAYVEVIHTDGGGLLGNGIGTAIGRVDFFVNGGNNQPGCLTHACSHQRAYELFAASMSNENLIGYPCSSQLQLNLNLCRGQALRLGTNRLMKEGSGIHRINTKKTFPF